jgi:hypothetical protein
MIEFQHEDGNFYNVWATYEDYQLSDNRVITLEVSGTIHCEDVEDLDLKAEDFIVHSIDDWIYQDVIDEFHQWYEDELEQSKHDIYDIYNDR